VAELEDGLQRREIEAATLWRQGLDAVAADVPGPAAKALIDSALRTESTGIIDAQPAVERQDDNIADLQAAVDRRSKKKAKVELALIGTHSRQPKHAGDGNAPGEVAAAGDDGESAEVGAADGTTPNAKKVGDQQDAGKTDGEIDGEPDQHQGGDNTGGITVKDSDSSKGAQEARHPANEVDDHFQDAEARLDDVLKCVGCDDECVTVPICEDSSVEVIDERIKLPFENGKKQCLPSTIKCKQSGDKGHEAMIITAVGEVGGCFKIDGLTIQECHTGIRIQDCNAHIFESAAAALEHTHVDTEKCAGVTVHLSNVQILNVSDVGILLHGDDHKLIATNFIIDGVEATGLSTSIFHAQQLASGTQQLAAEKEKDEAVADGHVDAGGDGGKPRMHEPEKPEEDKEEHVQGMQDKETFDNSYAIKVAGINSYVKLENFSIANVRAEYGVATVIDAFRPEFRLLAKDGRITNIVGYWGSHVLKVRDDAVHSNVKLEATHVKGIASKHSAAVVVWNDADHLTLSITARCRFETLQGQTNAAIVQSWGKFTSISMRGGFVADVDSGRREAGVGFGLWGRRSKVLVENVDMYCMGSMAAAFLFAKNSRYSNAVLRKVRMVDCHIGVNVQAPYLQIKIHDKSLVENATLAGIMVGITADNAHLEVQHMIFRQTEFAVFGRSMDLSICMSYCMIEQPRSHALDLVGKRHKLQITNTQVFEGDAGALFITSEDGSATLQDVTVSNCSTGLIACVGSLETKNVVVKGVHIGLKLCRFTKATVDVDLTSNDVGIFVPAQAQLTLQNSSYCFLNWQFDIVGIHPPNGIQRLDKFFFHIVAEEHFMVQSLLMGFATMLTMTAPALQAKPARKWRHVRPSVYASAAIAASLWLAAAVQSAMLFHAVFHREEKEAEEFRFRLFFRLGLGCMACVVLRLVMEIARRRLEIIADVKEKAKFQKETEQILASVTDSDLMADMMVQHRALKERWEAGDTASWQQIFNEMQPACKQEGDKLGAKLGEIRVALEAETRNNPLFEIQEVKGKPFVRLPPQVRDCDSLTAAKYLKRQASWMMQDFKDKLKGILRSTDRIYSTTDALKKGAITQADYSRLGHIDFEPERRPLRPHAKSTANNAICGLLTAPVKGLDRSVAKAETDYTSSNGYPEQPGIVYVGDWLRATYYASDGAVLALLFYMVAKEFGGVAKVKNKLADADKPDSFRIAIMMSVTMVDDTGFEMVCEVQLIPQDMLTIKDIQHLLYEVDRAEKVDDIVDNPIFDH
jgi:hypothetical protein